MTSPPGWQKPSPSAAKSSNLSDITAKYNNLLLENVQAAEKAKEEYEHAEKFGDYLLEIGAEYKLLPIEGPDYEFKDLREPLVFQLEHEKLVTSLIHNLMKVAKEENDYATESFLRWYVDEQVEEESNAAKAIALYDYYLAAGKGGLLLFDAKMGER